MDVLYEIGEGGAVIDIHELEGFHPLNTRALTGLAFIGDELFVASDDDEILVYQFASFGVEVPEGDSIVVEPIPDELEVGFPTVVDSGSLYVHVSGIDTCPPPEGVVFLPDFYEIVTTASFEYAAQIAMMTDEPLPPGIDPRKVRIFARPSGDCRPYMDITTAPIEFFDGEGERTFRVRTRTLSEDDEFSVFILGEDHRNPLDVIAMKFMYLEEAIDAVECYPPDPCEEMLELLARARMAFGRHRYARAAMFVDMIAEVALATPEIPHLYDPDMPGGNLGGRIVARAHTLSFSIRLLVRPEQVADGPLGPMLESSARLAENLVLSPNPSTSGFTMWLAPRGTEEVSLRIFSVKGELVRTLINNEHLAGSRTVIWDGTNADGLPVAAGTYFVVYTEGEQAITKKLILQR
jgi:hypothetical protein